MITPIKLEQLRVTQKDLRNPEQIAKMTGFANRGFFFNWDELAIKLGEGTNPALIELAVFEDGEYYIRDGHHRCIAISLSGRTFLSPSEVSIRQFKYSDWMYPNVETGWVTPFDPRIELRLGELQDFKAEVFKRSYPDNCNYIWNNREDYCIPRDGILTVKDLANYELEKLKTPSPLL